MPRQIDAPASPVIICLDSFLSSIVERAGSRSTSPALLLGRCFRHRLQSRQPLLELTADHSVHVHEQVDRLGCEIFVAGEAPRHGGSIALWLESELGGAGGGEGPREF